MADRPIMFSTTMIRAILDWRKTQTRRVLKLPHDNPLGSWELTTVGGEGQYKYDGSTIPITPAVWHTRTGDCIAPPILKQDRLWVKEKWRTFVSFDDTKQKDVWSQEQSRGAGIAYVAGGGVSITVGGEKYSYAEELDPDDLRAFGKVRSPMFMPRWASRITLIVTDVRIHRLHDISEDDAIAEGIGSERVIIGAHMSGGGHLGERYGLRYWNGTEPDRFEGHESAVGAYADLWDKINGQNSWDDDPWIVAYTFRCIPQNIDHIEEVAA